MVQTDWEHGMYVVKMAFPEGAFTTVAVTFTNASKEYPSKPPKCMLLDSIIAY